MQNNIRFLMDKHNVTPTVVARDLKMSRNTIYRLINGKKASSDTMFKIAKYFGQKIDDVFYTKVVLHEVHESIVPSGSKK